jgi:hypothetical protein
MNPDIRSSTVEQVLDPSGQLHRIGAVMVRRQVKCSVPDHQMDPRRTALFMARSILSD